MMVQAGKVNYSSEITLDNNNFELMELAQYPIRNACVEMYGIFSAMVFMQAHTKETHNITQQSFFGYKHPLGMGLLFSYQLI